MATKIPVGATIARTYGFAFGNFFTNLGAIWIPLALVLAGSYLLLPSYMAIISQMMDAPLHPGDPTQAAAARMVAQHNMALVVKTLPYQAAFIGLALFAYASVASALVREALGLRTGSVLLALPFGPSFWRLLVVCILLALIALVFYVLTLAGGIIFWVTSIRASLLAGSLYPVAGFGAVLLLCIGAMIFIMTRLSFFVGPIAVVEERISLGRSWQLTRGNFWRILVVMLAVLVPLMAAYIALFHFVYRHDFFPPLHQGTTLKDIQDWGRGVRQAGAAMVASRLALWYVYYPVSLLIAVVVYGLLVGSAAFSYRALAPTDSR
jgi:hypothetical protein